MEKIAQERGREANIAPGEAECYISLETKPECFFPYCTCGNALTSLLYWLVIRTNCKDPSWGH